MNQTKTVALILSVGWLVVFFPLCLFAAGAQCWGRPTRDVSALW